MAHAPLCPVDDAALEPHAHGALAFHGCARCHGLWFTAAAMDGTRDGAVPADPFSGRTDAAPTPHVAWRVRLCPGCRGTLRARQVEGVEVDTCPGCRSVWLDAGELDTVVAWQRLRDRSLAGPVAAAAGAVAMSAGAAHAEASRPSTAGETAGETALDAAEVALEVVAGDGWVAVEMIGDLAGFLGQTVAGGAEVAVDVAGAVLSLVGGLLEGL